MIDGLSPVIAHRGLSVLAPENTLAALQLAYEYGIDWVEVDASLLGDHTPVLCHDDTLERCSNRQGSLMDISATDLPDIDAGSWFSPAFSGITLPLLTQVLDWLSRHDMGLNLELKAQPGVSSKTIVEAIQPLVRAHWQSKRPLVISSFDHALLHEYRRVDADQAIGLLYEALPSDWPHAMQQVNAISVHCNWKHLTHAQATQVKALGYSLLVYTCNDQDSARDLWSMGVDAVISDCPHLLHA